MRNLKTFIYLVVYFLSQRFFKLLGYFWPKDKRLLVFSGLKGVSYTDNTRYLFEKFCDYYSEEFKITWITASKILLNKIKNMQSARGRIIYQWSLAGLLTVLRARIVFYLSDASDIPFVLFSKRTITVQLWHGIPMKRICLLKPRWAKYPPWLVKYFYFSMYSYWLCSSTIDRIATALCVGLPIDRVLITGYPRNDYLIEHKRAPSTAILDRFPFLQKRIILYAPTWRQNSVVRFFPFADFSYKAINEFLEKNDAYLLLRGHRYERSFLGEVDCQSFIGDRIIDGSKAVFEDVQELLPFVDILISDYSGIWIDYLLLDRPIVFVPYDLQEFEIETGLLYNYDFITPGPKVSTTRDLIEAMREYTLHPEKDAGKRSLIKNIFHEYEDGRSYERIYNFIMQVA